MQDYSLTRCYPKEEKHIDPDFIYNRYDLWTDNNHENMVVWHYQDQTHTFYVESVCCGETAKLGIWLMPMETKILMRIAKAVFKEFSGVRKIVIENATCDYKGRSFQNNHFRIELPESTEVLDQRLSSKGRYNIRREKRLIREKFNGYEIRNYSGIDVVSDKIWDAYFQYKFEGKKTHYGLSPTEYCTKYHVTDAYTLELGDDHKIAAIMLSCEQCSIVYLENMAFDENLASFSPGQVLYDEYLKALIKKEKKELYLAGGDYEYKKRYNSIEDIVWKGVIYRYPIINYGKWIDCLIRRKYHHIVNIYRGV